jgi:hypothetical protein
MVEILLAALATSAVVAAGVLLVGRLAPSLPSIERTVAGIVVAYVAVCSMAQLLSLFGAIGRTGFLAGAGAFFLAAVALRRRGPTETAHAISSSTSERALVAASVVGTAIVLATWLWKGVSQPVLVVSDGPIYHLPFAVRWLQDGSLSRTWTPFGEMAAPYFPGNGEVWMAWLLALVGDDRFSKVSQWFFLPPCALALVGLARNANGGSVAAAWPPIAWCGCILVVVTSVKPDVDVPMTFALLAGLLLLDRAWRESNQADRNRSLMLAALSFGAAAGTKSVGLMFGLGPMLLVLWSARRSWTAMSGCVVGAIVGGSYWYIRNWVQMGNPVYPLKISLGGRMLFDGWYDAAVMRGTSHYHIPIPDYMEFAKQIAFCLYHPSLLAALAVSLATGVYFIAKDRNARPTLLLCVGFSLVWAAGYWIVQPYNTQQRFLLPAIAAAFVPLGMFRGWLSILPATACAIPLAVGLFPNLMFKTGIPFLAGAASMFLADDSQEVRFDWRPTTLAVALSALALGWISRPGCRLHWSFVAAVVLPLFLAPTAFKPRIGSATPLFYSTNDFGGRLFPAWARIQAGIDRDSGTAVVGYAGSNLPYYLAGPRLQNRVRYVNVQGYPEWLPHDHFRDLKATGRERPADAAFPQWHRSHPDERTWLSNLDALGVDYFLVARENYHGRPDAPSGLAPFPVEYEWLVKNPDRFERLGPTPGPNGEEPWGIGFRVRQATRGLP